MTKEDYVVFLGLINAASFKGEKAEYIADLKYRVKKEIEICEKGSEK